MGSAEKSQSPALRVLMVTGIYPTDRYPHRGTFVKTLVESLRAQGVYVEVLCPPPGQFWWRYPLVIFQIWWKVCFAQFDLIHGHYGQWCFFARLQWKYPVVAAFLGDDLLGTVTASGKQSRMSRVIVRLSRWLCRHVDAVLVKSAEMSQASGSETAQVVPDGVDFTLFQPKNRAQMRNELGWSQQRYYVLFANNPAIPVKNFALAQAAVACLKSRGVDLELVVASGLPQCEVVRLLNACNVLISPSYAEGSPNVVKEAMACNIPVVATDVGDVAEIIWRTQGCSICPARPEAMALGLLRAFSHPGETTGRKDIAYLEASHVAGQTILIYQEILQTHKVKQQEESFEC